MTKAKEILLDEVIAVFGYEHEKTIKFAEILEKASDDADAVEALKGLALTIINQELKEREDN